MIIINDHNHNDNNHNNRLIPRCPQLQYTLLMLYPVWASEVFKVPFFSDHPASIYQSPSTGSLYFLKAASVQEAVSLSA